MYEELRQKGFSPDECDYIVEQINKAKSEAIKNFAEWLPKNFDLRFSNRPNVWVDEYFNHTIENIMKKLKDKQECTNLN